MKYNKALNRLEPIPEVKPPMVLTLTNYGPPDNRHEWDAYNNWLSQCLEIVGNPTWEDGQEVAEGVDFEIKERWKPLPREGATNSGIIYQPVFVAIVLNQETKTKDMEQEIMKAIYSNPHWHTWKCRCGCLNGKGNANCSRCGGMATPDAKYYGGDDIIHGGLWEPSIQMNLSTPKTD